MTNPIFPDYYDFPSGVEPKDISAYLTWNAGNAIAYIARSTRVDGNYKDDDPNIRVQDLQKAIAHLKDEVDLIQNE